MVHLVIPKEGSGMLGSERVALSQPLILSFSLREKGRFNKMRVCKSYDICCMKTEVPAQQRSVSRHGMG